MDGGDSMDGQDKRHATSPRSLCTALRTSPTITTKPPETMAPKAPEKEYTMEEVSKHNKAEDCWLVIGNSNTGQFLFSRRLLVVWMTK
jgi:cytochrome b involved in lipid metabolism